MLKISIMTMVFGGALSDGTLTDVGMLHALESAGFDGIEVFSGHFVGHPERVKTCGRYLADSKLEVTCVDAGCNFVGRDAAARTTACDALRAGIDLARTLRAPVVLAAGSQLFDGCSPADGRKMIIDGLQTCMPAARKAGVTLAIEDFGVAPTLQCVAADCAEVLDAVPGLAFVFDTGNFYFCGEDPLRNLDLLAHRTCHVHLKDWVKSDTPEIADVSGTALGNGLIPNEEIVHRLLAKRYTGGLSIELGAPGDKMQAARKDLETVRAWLT